MLWHKAQGAGGVGGASIIAYAVNFDNLTIRLLELYSDGSIGLADTYTLPSEAEFPMCAAFSPVGNYIAVGSFGDRKVTLLNHTVAGTLSLADTYGPLGQYANGLSFSPDGNYLACAIDTGSSAITLLNSTSGTLSFADSLALNRFPRSVDFDNTGSYIVAALSNGSGDMYALADHTTSGSLSLANSLGGNNFGVAVKFSGDGNYVIGSDGGSFLETAFVRLIDRTTDNVISFSDSYVIPAEAYSVDFEASGNYAAVAVRDTGVYLFQTTTTLALSDLVSLSSVSSAKFDPTGAYVYVGDGSAPTKIKTYTYSSGSLSLVQDTTGLGGRLEAIGPSLL